MRYPVRFVSALPSERVVGGVQATVAVPLASALTLIEKGGRLERPVPSVAEITTFAKLPTLEADGVPLRRPVAVSNVAQAGRFWISNVIVSPFASVAVGVKLQARPVTAAVVGLPEMAGAVFDPDGGGLPPPPL